MSEEHGGKLASGPTCPLRLDRYPTITMAHGGGGKLTRTLIDDLFVAAFDNPTLRRMHDGALLEVDSTPMAFTTDSFVIDPIFFPGGDIGSLAVHGTVNDLAMCGAQPIALSAGFILEEGLAMEDLWRLATSMSHAAAEAGVSIVTGDTKVVDRGKCDKLYINTTGLGRVLPGARISPKRARPGDVVLISGPIADHGIAVMSVREGLEFETEIISDSAALNEMARRLVETGRDKLHVMRDPTRGGLATALNEIAEQANVGIRLDETSIPVRDQVRGACEILGLDPLYVANEGKCIAIGGKEVAGRLLQAMRSHRHGREAAIIGEVVREHPGKVHLTSSVGGERVVTMLAGDQLPRIC